MAYFEWRSLLLIATLQALVSGVVIGSGTALSCSGSKCTVQYVSSFSLLTEVGSCQSVYEGSVTENGQEIKADNSTTVTLCVDSVSYFQPCQEYFQVPVGQWEFLYDCGFIFYDEISKKWHAGSCDEDYIKNLLGSGTYVYSLGARSRSPNEVQCKSCGKYHVMTCVAGGVNLGAEVASVCVIKPDGIWTLNLKFTVEGEDFKFSYSGTPLQVTFKNHTLNFDPISGTPVFEQTRNVVDLPGSVVTTSGVASLGLYSLPIGNGLNTFDCDQLYWIKVQGGELQHGDLNVCFSILNSTILQECQPASGCCTPLAVDCCFSGHAKVTPSPRLGAPMLEPWFQNAFKLQYWLPSGFTPLYMNHTQQGVWYSVDSPFSFILSITGNVEQSFVNSPLVSITLTSFATAGICGAFDGTYTVIAQSDSLGRANLYFSSGDGAVCNKGPLGATVPVVSGQNVIQGLTQANCICSDVNCLSVTAYCESEADITDDDDHVHGVTDDTHDKWHFKWPHFHFGFGLGGVITVLALILALLLVLCCICCCCQIPARRAAGL